MAVHKCPVRACAVYCESHTLICIRHWDLVPGPMKAAVLTEFRRGVGSAAHAAACEAAIRAVEEKIQAIAGGRKCS